MKNLRSLLIIISALFTFHCIQAEDSQWKTYQNKNCKYQIDLPASSEIKDIKDNLRTSFYFNPVQFLDNLKNNPSFKNISFDDNCVTQVIFPIQAHTTLNGKFLFIYKLDNAPPDWPPLLPSLNLENKGKLVRAGGKTFFLVNDSDMGMCHDYRYQYYFLKNKASYYVLQVFLKAHCRQDPKDMPFNLEQETQDFEKIIASFQAN